jgi:hypothetical protein
MKVLCFAPNDAVWRWTLPQAQFLEALKQRGDAISYLYCDRTFAKYCMSMASMGVPIDASIEAKAAICAKCTANSALVRDRLGFEGHALHGYLTDSERAQALDLAKNSSVPDLIAYKFDGIAVGRFALYEMIIQTKSLSLELSTVAENYYRIVFENAVLTAFATRRALDQDRPDIGITYHTAHCYNRVFQNLAEARGIPVWFLNASMNMAELDTHLVAARSDPEVFIRKLMAEWHHFADLPVGPTSIAAATDHLLTLMRGGGLAYSTAMKKRGYRLSEHFGCAPSKKILLALLSSYDELLAAEYAGFGWSSENSVFKDQIDWISYLYKYAKEHRDVHIIIRVHPREFSGNKGSPRSAHSTLLAEAFAQHPENVSINLPTDGIAVYELLVEADVALVAWSSAGMEAGMFGIPVVTWFGNALLYPPALTFEVNSRADYKATVEQALASGWSLERARMFYRWAVLLFVRTRIDMTNGRASSARSGWLARFTQRALNSLRLRLTPWTDQIWTIERRPKLLDARSDIYALIDQRHAAFYEIAKPEPTADENAELATLVKQLRVVADRIWRDTGMRPERLDAMIAEQTQKVA